MKRHPTDLLSFVPGVLFVALATAALAGGLPVEVLDLEWLWPVTLVVLGLMVLASTGRGGGTADDTTAEPADDGAVGAADDGADRGDTGAAADRDTEEGTDTAW